MLVLAWDWCLLHKSDLTNDIVTCSVSRIRSYLFAYIELSYFFLTGIGSSHTHSKEFFQIQAVLRVSLGNFLFFIILALIMIGVKDRNDRRDSWQHGGWIAKMVIWLLLVVLMFFLPDVVISVYGLFCDPPPNSSIILFLIINCLESDYWVCFLFINFPLQVIWFWRVIHYIHSKELNILSR